MDISSMLEVQVEELPEENKLCETNPVRKSNNAKNAPCNQYSAEENSFFQKLFSTDISSVRFRRLHCTCCDEHIGSAPGQAHNMHEHPVLRTLLCAECREFYGEGIFEQGEDQTDMYCRWCANGGNLYCCSYCSNTFCKKCIKRNLEPKVVKRIEDDEKWKCFVCDPKDLFLARSVCRSLIQHVENVIRILGKDKTLSTQDTEAKMNLDESKCCINRRKKRKRSIVLDLSESDDENGRNKISSSYVPYRKTDSQPPTKKRRVKRESITKNGYTDHIYNLKSPTDQDKSERDLTDLLVPREQTMVEGDAEILNPDDLYPANKNQNSVVNQPIQVQPMTVIPRYNALPIKNMFKVVSSTANGPIRIVKTNTTATATTSYPIKIINPNNNKNISLLRVPKSTLKTKRLNFANISHQINHTNKETPKLIDLESDDESEVTQISKSKTKLTKTLSNGLSSSIESGITDEVITETNHVNDESKISNQTEIKISNKSKKRDKNISIQEKEIQRADSETQLKMRQRDQRFKKMLLLQSQEIDKTVSELKGKMSKILQSTDFKSQPDKDLLDAAALCTKRFNRAMRKALTDLATVNDKLVKDYVYWKKKFIHTDSLKNSGTHSERSEKCSQKPFEDDILLEMTCTNDSESESENEENDDILKILTSTTMESSQILENLTIYKKKPTAVKSVGSGSVLTHDKAVQVYDVPWIDLEKKIGYSLLPKMNSESESQKECNEPVKPRDVKLHEYQEQFIYHLQNIEDKGYTIDDDSVQSQDSVPCTNVEKSTRFSLNMFNHPSPGSSGEVTPLHEVPSALSPQEVLLDGDFTRETHHHLPTTSKNLEDLMNMVTQISNNINEEESGSNGLGKSKCSLSKEEETLIAVQSLIESESIELNEVCLHETDPSYVVNNQECTPID